MPRPKTRRFVLYRAYWVGFSACLLVTLLSAVAVAQDSPPADPPPRDPPPHSAPPIITPPDSLISPAVEDTTFVRRKHLSLAEIIERCIEGEKTKLGGHRDMTHTTTIRTMLTWRKKREIRDIVYRLYDDADGLSRSVQLGELVHNFERDGESWKRVEKEDEENVQVRVETGGFNDFNDLPFFLEEVNEYHFELIDRTVLDDHVIFEIDFDPKSDFKGLPSGKVYVDTDRYRIIHEEFRFERNPFPLFLKDIRRISRHWEELPGGEWVFTKVMMDVDLRADPFGFSPEDVAVSILRSDFEFDVGYDERLFGER